MTVSLSRWRKARRTAVKILDAFDVLQQVEDGAVRPGRFVPMAFALVVVRGTHAAADDAHRGLGGIDFCFPQ